MRLLDAPPCAQLAEFIESYWYVEVRAHETNIRPDAILPSGTANLIFNLSGFPHRDYRAGSFELFDLLKTRWFSGIHDNAIIVGPTVCTKVIGIRFRPGGLVPFVDVPSIEMARMTLDADAVWGNECKRIHEQLLDLSGVNQQFQLLERWMLARFNSNEVHVGLLRSVSLLQEMSGAVPIEQLARLANLSLRQYRRRFERAVGVSPKRLARILRFHKLIEQLGDQAEQSNWAGLAIDCGYYDQAHLIADFREFADVTPSEYVRRKPLVPGFLPVDASMSLFSNTVSQRPVRILAS